LPDISLDSKPTLHYNMRNMAIAQNKKNILALVGILLVGILLVVLLSASMGCDCGCKRKDSWAVAAERQRQALAAALAAKQPPSSYVHLNPLLLPPIEVNPNTLSGDTFIIPGGGPGGGSC
jgi:hypothetical protein